MKRISVIAGVLSILCGAAGCNVILANDPLPAGPTGDAAADGPSSEGGEMGDGSTDGSTANDSATAKDAGNDAPTTCTANLTNDDKNCGACGHDCLGTACTNSMCEPALLASAGLPTTIDVDDANVYFDAQVTRTVSQCPNTGCVAAPITLSNNPANYAIEVRTDGTDVYWTESGNQVLRCAVGGCAAAGPTKVRDATSAGALVVSATTVFNGYSGFGLEVTDKATLADQGAFGASGIARAITTDPKSATQVFYTTAHAVVRCADPATCGNGLVLNASIVNGAGVATDGVNVYWVDAASNGADGAIRSCAITGCATPKDIATGQVRPNQLRIDGSTLYWVNIGTNVTSKDGEVVKCPTTGCGAAGPTKIATQQKQPWSLAVRGQHVYWVNKGTSNTDGAVYRAAK